MSLIFCKYFLALAQAIITFRAPFAVSYGLRKAFLLRNYCLYDCIPAILREYRCWRLLFDRLHVINEAIPVSTIFFMFVEFLDKILS